MNKKRIAHSDKRIIMNIKHLATIGLGIFMLSCNPRNEDIAGEDYDSIFKFTGIDQPDISYDDMTTRKCDPEMALEKYKYPGVELPNKREYEVVLKVKYTDLDYTSQYEVRYINENKEIKVIGSDASDSNLSEHLENGVEKIIKIKAFSGYPMYISVNGIGPQNSSIEASISATSKDGYIVVPQLGTKQYQNQEGPNKIDNPYCGYIILP